MGIDHIYAVFLLIFIVFNASNQYAVNFPNWLVFTKIGKFAFVLLKCFKSSKVRFLKVG